MKQCTNVYVLRLYHSVIDRAGLCNDSCFARWVTKALETPMGTWRDSRKTFCKEYQGFYILGKIVLSLSQVTE